MILSAIMPVFPAVANLIYYRTITPMSLLKNIAANSFTIFELASTLCCYVMHCTKSGIVEWEGLLGL